jgi:Protein of unknown function (DUF3168)
MSGTSILELETAIVQAVRADSTLTGGSTPLITGIWNEGAVPEQQAFPYCVIGQGDELPQNTLGRKGYQPTITIDVFSHDNGFDECYAIMKELNRLLDEQPLTLATQIHVYTMYKHSHALNDPDRITRHLVIEYDFFTQE